MDTRVGGLCLYVSSKGPGRVHGSGSGHTSEAACPRYGKDQLSRECVNFSLYSSTMQDSPAMKRLPDCSKDIHESETCPLCTGRPRVELVSERDIFSAQGADDCLRLFRCPACLSTCCGKRGRPLPINKPKPVKVEDTNADDEMDTQDKSPEVPRG